MTDWDHTPPEGQPYNPAPPPMPPGAAAYPPDPAGNQPPPPAQPGYQQPAYQPPPPAQPQYQQPQYQQPQYQQPQYQQPAAGGYGPPPGAPGAPAPAPGGPTKSPLSFLTGMSKQTRLIAGGVALLVVIALVLGVFVLGGPNTVSEREFAAKACSLQSEWQENLTDTFEDSDVLQDIYGGDLSKKDAEAAKTFMVGLFTSSRQYIDRMRTLIDENVVDHEDGEALRDDLLESYDNAIEEFEKAKSDLEDIETDSSAGADELVRFFNDEDEYNTDIDVSSSVEDLASDINERMADLDDNCLDGIADI